MIAIITNRRPLIKKYLLSLPFPTEACCEVTGIDDGDADEGTDEDTVFDTITRKKKSYHCNTTLETINC